MTYKITSFNYDNKYRGCTLTCDNNLLYQSTTGDYNIDLKSMLDCVRHLGIIITPSNLIITHSDVQ